jgi:hypothetical protein
MDSDIQEAIPPLYRGLGTSVAGIVPYAVVDLCMNSLLKVCTHRLRIVLCLARGDRNLPLNEGHIPLSRYF